MDNNNLNNTINGISDSPGFTGESLSIVLLYYITAFLIAVISIIFINKRI